MTRFRTAFSYYGGKGSLVDLYPAPECDTIIEPFAGSAAYALRYADRNVIISDLDERTIAIWRFLTRPDASQIAYELVPRTVQIGDRVTDMLPADADRGLLELLQAEANCGAGGTHGTKDRVTKMAAPKWHKVLQRILHYAPRVQHWQVIHGAAQDLPNQRATWFIDPPYSNAAGDEYRHAAQHIDFERLGAWVREREGQVIACENAGATWLPFEHLSRRRGITSSYQVSDAAEVVWHRPADGGTLPARGS